LNAYFGAPQRLQMAKELRVPFLILPSNRGLQLSALLSSNRVPDRQAFDLASRRTRQPDNAIFTKK
jgi:hypothetical protein